MRKHYLSLAALMVMIVLAFGSMDTSNVSKRGSGGSNSGANSATTRSDTASPNTESSDTARSDTASSDTASSNSAGSDTASAPVVHKMNEAVHVGYTSYKVWKTWWSNNLSSNQFLNQRADASYLFVELSVRNDDTKARMIPPLKLIDENNSEYEASAKGWAVPGSIGILDKLSKEDQKFVKNREWLNAK